MDQVPIQNRFVVISFGPRGLTGKPNEKWFDTLQDAQDEVRLRLQVRRLHSSARIQGREYPGDRAWQRDCLTWRSIGVINYREVSQKHPEFEQSGGCRIHQVRTVTEDKPFDPSSLRFRSRGSA